MKHLSNATVVPSIHDKLTGKYDRFINAKHGIVNFVIPSKLRIFRKRLGTESIPTQRSDMLSRINNQSPLAFFLIEYSLDNSKLFNDITAKNMMTRQLPIILLSADGVSLISKYEQPFLVLFITPNRRQIQLFQNDSLSLLLNANNLHEGLLQTRWIILHRMLFIINQSNSLLHKKTSAKSD